MKHLLSLGMVCFLGIAQVYAQTKTFELEGDVAKLKNVRKAVLVYQAGGKQIVDSVPITDGKFKFTGSLNGPVISELWAIDRSFRNVQYIENAKMTIVQKEPGTEVILTGSATDKEYELVRKNQREYKALLAEAAKAADQLIPDSAAAQKKYDEMDRLAANKYVALTTEFVKAHPKSVVSLNELAKTSGALDAVTLQSLYNGLDDALKLSPAGEALGKTVTMKMSTGIGMNATDFTQKNDKGEEVRLASFKGKYVLIDFWASWCVPCRKENPNVVKIYNRYKSKGFEILGVSLDQKEDKWKEAIVKDQLTWTQVSDLKGWANSVAVQYGVTSVPATYLLNPQGVIIAKDLRGEELAKKLAELFPD